jgi:FtsZ-binding cell division protein ZapB
MSSGLTLDLAVISLSALLPTICVEIIRWMGKRQDGANKQTQTWADTIAKLFGEIAELKAEQRVLKEKVEELRADTHRLKNVIAAYQERVRDILSDHMAEDVVEAQMAKYAAEDERIK